MSRFQLLIVAAAALIASPCLAQDDQSEANSAVAAPQESDATSPATRPGSDQLELSATLTSDERSAGKTWTSDSDTTSSRTGGRASSVRVIRACEISLTLDGDCAGR